MSEFFRGWRRKCGVLTLLMALGFAAGWVRSLNRTDSALFPIRNSLTLQLISKSATLTMRRFESPYRVKQTTGNADRIYLEGVDTFDDLTPAAVEMTLDETISHCGYPYLWTIRFWGIEYGYLDVTRTSLRVGIWKIPYWSLTVPLTLISAWLLLSKPKTSTSKNVTRSSQGEGEATS